MNGNAPGHHNFLWSTPKAPEGCQIPVRHTASICSLPHGRSIKLERAFEKLPQPSGPVRVRADGAFFNHKIIEFIEEKGACYAIVARLTRPLKNWLLGLRYRHVSPGVWQLPEQVCWGPRVTLGAGQSS